MNSNKIQKKLLGDFCSFKYGKTIRKSEISSEGLYPVFSGYQIVGYLDSFIYKKPQLIIVCRGVGGTGDIKISPPQCSITNLSIIISVNKEIDENYLYWVLRNTDTYSLRTGSAQPQITITDLERFPVAIQESLIDQKAIAHILRTLDHKIEVNKKTNDTLEGLSRELFKSWFINFDPVKAKSENRSTGLPDEINQLFPDSFEESYSFECPKNWHLSTLGKEADLMTGFPFKSDRFSNSPPGVLLARGMNVKEGVFFWDSQARFWNDMNNEIEKYLLDTGDVLIGMDGSKVGKNWVRVRETDLPCLLVQRVARLRYKDSIGETFLRFLIGSQKFTAYVDLVKTGTSIPHISLKQIKNYSFIRPSIGDNRLFAAYEDITAPITKKVDKNRSQSIALKSLRDILLPKLISGELRIPDAEKMIEEAEI